MIQVGRIVNKKVEKPITKIENVIFTVAVVVISTVGSKYVGLRERGLYILDINRYISAILCTLTAGAKNLKTCETPSQR